LFYIYTIIQNIHMEKSLVTPEEGFIFNCTVIEPEFGDEDFKVLGFEIQFIEKMPA
jgi:hypothetical protein